MSVALGKAHKLRKTWPASLKLLLQWADISVLLYISELHDWERKRERLSTKGWCILWDQYLLGITVHACTTLINSLSASEGTTVLSLFHLFTPSLASPSPAARDADWTWIPKALESFWNRTPMECWTLPQGPELLHCIGPPNAIAHGNQLRA